MTRKVPLCNAFFILGRLSKNTNTVTALHVNVLTRFTFLIPGEPTCISLLFLACHTLEYFNKSLHLYYLYIDIRRIR